MVSTRRSQPQRRRGPSTRVRLSISLQASARRWNLRSRVGELHRAAEHGRADDLGLSRSSRRSRLRHTQVSAVADPRAPVQRSLDRRRLDPDALELAATLGIADLAQVDEPPLRAREQLTPRGHERNGEPVPAVVVATLERAHALLGLLLRRRVGDGRTLAVLEQDLVLDIEALA